MIIHQGGGSFLYMSIVQGPRGQEPTDGASTTATRGDFGSSLFRTVIFPRNQRIARSQNEKIRQR